MKRVMQKFSQGSILAYSLILLSIVLVASIGMMAASVTNLKSLSSNNRSTNAFQIADSGSQAVVAQIKKDSSGKISDLADRMGVSCDNSSNSVSVSLLKLNGQYRVTFFGDDTANPQLKCNDDVSLITSVKSVGTYANTARAVEVAVAAAGASGVTGGCRLSNTTISEVWGVGCKTSGSASSATCDGAKDSSTSACGLSGLPSGTDMVCICVAK